MRLPYRLFKKHQFCIYGNCRKSFFYGLAEVLSIFRVFTPHHRAIKKFYRIWFSGLFHKTMFNIFLKIDSLRKNSNLRVTNLFLMFLVHGAHICFREQSFLGLYYLEAVLADLLQYLVHVTCFYGVGFDHHHRALFGYGLGLQGLQTGFFLGLHLCLQQGVNELENNTPSYDTHCDFKN